MEAKVSQNEIEQLIERFYGVKTENVEFMDAYEGANIRVRLKDDYKHDCQSSKFVLKLSKTDPLSIDLQISMINHLNDRRIKTLIPVKTVGGNFVFEYMFGKDSSGEAQRWTIHMFYYLEGITAYSAGNPDHLITDIGRVIGKMDSALKDFKTDIQPKDEIVWELTCLPQLRDLLPQFCDHHFIIIGKEIIDEYTYKIVPDLKNCHKGFIHGDVNNCNILVQPIDLENSASNYSITGIIDFGDACLSYYVYEVASTMADFMTSTFHSRDIIGVGKRILHGYCKEFRLNEIEIGHLRIFLCVRLLQMFVLNSKASKESPHNKYLQLEIEESGKVCELLWQMSDEEFNKKFQTNELNSHIMTLFDAPQRKS